LHKTFKVWRIDDVTLFGYHEIEILLSDSSIICNKKKIGACTENARIIQSIQKQFGSFCYWFYDIIQGNDLKEFQAILKKEFRFVGLEIARMWFMGSAGIPSDNLN